MTRTIAATLPRPQWLARTALTLAGGIALLTAAPRSAEAQTEAPAKGSRWEFVVPSGTLVPTGAQRNVLKRGGLLAAQLHYVARPGLAFNATVGWARSRDIASAGDPKLDVFMYDLGAEARAPEMNAGRGFSFRPFVGVGGGVRSYNYRSLAVDATHNLVAYGSAGGEIGYRRVRLRLEARDYVSGFKPLVGTGAGATRNDVAVMIGLRIAAPRA